MKAFAVEILDYSFRPHAIEAGAGFVRAFVGVGKRRYNVDAIVAGGRIGLFYMRREGGARAVQYSAKDLRRAIEVAVTAYWKQMEAV